jgi:hypothetical protein
MGRSEVDQERGGGGVILPLIFASIAGGMVVWGFAIWKVIDLIV